jgi:hypothetical protein
MTTDTLTPTLDTRSARRPPTWRTLVVVGAPLAWIPIAFLHPGANPDSVYEDLAAAADRWLYVHLAQLVLTLWFGVVMWMAVAGRRSLAATITRAAVPVYLVSFAAFDSVAGISTGLAVRHAQSLPSAQADGVASTTEYLALNYFTGDFSPLSFISGISLSAAVVGVAMTLRSVGAARWIWISALGGVLLNLHAAGVIPAVGLAALAGALYSSDRMGYIVRPPTY